MITPGYLSFTPVFMNPLIVITREVVPKGQSVTGPFDMLHNMWLVLKITAIQRMVEKRELN